MSTIESKPRTRRSRIGPRSAGVSMTPEEFDATPEWAWDDRYRYELINGVLVVTPPVSDAEADPNDDLGYLLRLYKETHPQGHALDATMPERTVPATPQRRRCDRAIWAGFGRLPDTRDRHPHDRRSNSSRSSDARCLPRLRAETRRIHRRRRARVLDHRPLSADHDRLSARAVRAGLPDRHRGIRDLPDEVLPGFELPLARLLVRSRPSGIATSPRNLASPRPPPEGPMVKIRRCYEALFLGLFLFFLLITDLRYLKGWPVSLFLEATPLVAVATALTTHTIYRNLVWGLVIIAITMMLGRVWCNWMCPFGILHHLFGCIGNRRNTKQMIEVNRYRKIYAIKYYILAAMLAMAVLWIIPTLIDAPSRPPEPMPRRPEPGAASLGQVFAPAALLGLIALLGVGLAAASVLPVRLGGLRSAAVLKGVGILALIAALGGLAVAGPWRTLTAAGVGLARSAEEHKTNRSSLQIGLLDPIALTVRSMTTSVLPTVHKATESVYTEPREYWQAWIVGLIFIGFLVANWWIPRFFCRAYLPAGCTPRAVQPVLALADRSRPGAVHRLRPLPQELRRSVRPASRPAQERMLRLPELHRRLPARRPLIPVLAAEGQRGGLSGGRPPRDASGRALRPGLLPDDPPLSGGVKKNFSRLCHPASRVGRGGRVPAPLHQVRPVHPRVPHQRPSARIVRGGTGRALDPDHDLQDGLVRAELHALQPGLPHRRHPRDLDRREAGSRPVRGQGTHQDRHGVL